MNNTRSKLLRLAAESEILALRLARCEEIRFRRGGALVYILKQCGYQDTGLQYNGKIRFLPPSLSSAIKTVYEANDRAFFQEDYGALAGALMGLARIIRHNIGAHDERSGREAIQGGQGSERDRRGSSGWDLHSEWNRAHVHI